MTEQAIKPLPATEREVRIRRALISVSDKAGLEAFARALAEMGVEILSTGGTAKALAGAGVKVVDISAHTGFPEIMDGRVKTLHPKVHGGILARRDNPEDIRAMSENGIEDIDLIVVNLYPFTETVASGADFAQCIENIDIGGPAMIRAAAKNHEFVTIVTHADDYEAVLSDLRARKGAVGPALRKRLAAKAYALTASYDAAIALWFAGQEENRIFPPGISFSGKLQSALRYGENPHQEAAFYTDGSARPGVASARQIQGKELSYNNLNDTDAAFELVSEFSDLPSVAIIKHANPCGVASAATLEQAYRLALRCDPVSAFGGIIALNRPLDEATAAEIVKIFSEVVIAPSIEPAALAVLARKNNLRVLTTGGLADPAEARLTVKTLAGGLLVQTADNGRVTQSDLKTVTKRAPDAREIEDLLFAFKVAKHVKSNAIVYAKDGTTVGIGAGQMSRIDSSRIAAQKALEAAKLATGDASAVSLAQGSVLASDAFFPFADGLVAAAEAGVTAVIQPGGSIRDEEVIAAADARGIAMVFTGMRHFRH